MAFKSPESGDESEDGSDDEAKTSEEFIQQGGPQIIYDPQFCHRDFDFGHHRYPQFNGSNIFEDNKINKVCRMFHINSSQEQAVLYAYSTGCRRRNT